MGEQSLEFLEPRSGRIVACKTRGTAELVDERIKRAVLVIGRAEIDPSQQPNSLLAGRLQGISSIRSSAARERQQNTALNQRLTSQFPTHPEQGIFCGLAGNLNR
jgi:hypothetical protein